jgi:GNAT superfamily N-acetyltransferase
MHPVELVPAGESDASFVASVARDAILLYDPLMPGSFERFAARVERDGLPTAFRTFLVHADRRPVGFAGLDATLPDGIVYLAALYLRTESRRRGIGSAALQAIARDASAAARELVLLVHRDATWARAFYVHHGFHLVTADPSAIRDYAAGALARHALPASVPSLLLSRALDPLSWPALRWPRHG